MPVTSSSSGYQSGANPITKATSISTQQNTSTPTPSQQAVKSNTPSGVYYSSNPNWKPSNPNAVVVYIDKSGNTTGQSSIGGTSVNVPSGVNVQYQPSLTSNPQQSQAQQFQNSLTQQIALTGGVKAFQSPQQQTQITSATLQARQQNAQQENALLGQPTKSGIFAVNPQVQQASNQYGYGLNNFWDVEKTRIGMVVQNPSKFWNVLFSPTPFAFSPTEVARKKIGIPPTSTAIEYGFTQLSDVGKAAVGYPTFSANKNVIVPSNFDVGKYQESIGGGSVNKMLETLGTNIINPSNVVKGYVSERELPALSYKTTQQGTQLQQSFNKTLSNAKTTEEENAIIQQYQSKGLGITKTASTTSSVLNPQTGETTTTTNNQYQSTFGKDFNTELSKYTINTYGQATENFRVAGAIGTTFEEAAAIGFLTGGTGIASGIGSVGTAASLTLLGGGAALTGYASYLGYEKGQSTGQQSLAYQYALEPVASYTGFLVGGYAGSKAYAYDVKQDVLEGQINQIQTRQGVKYNEENGYGYEVKQQGRALEITTPEGRVITGKSLGEGYSYTDEETGVGIETGRMKLTSNFEGETSKAIVNYYRDLSTGQTDFIGKPETMKEFFSGSEFMNSQTHFVGTLSKNGQEINIFESNIQRSLAINEPTSEIPQNIRFLTSDYKYGGTSGELVFQTPTGSKFWTTDVTMYQPSEKLLAQSQETESLINFDVISKSIKNFPFSYQQAQVSIPVTQESDLITLVPSSSIATASSNIIQTTSSTGSIFKAFAASSLANSAFQSSIAGIGLTSIITPSLVTTPTKSSVNSITKTYSIVSPAVVPMITPSLITTPTTVTTPQTITNTITNTITETIVTPVVTPPYINIPKYSFGAFAIPFIDAGGGAGEQKYINQPTSKKKKIYYTESFTARLLGIKTKQPYSQIARQSTQGFTGLEIRGIPKGLSKKLKYGGKASYNIKTKKLKMIKVPNVKLRKIVEGKAEKLLKIKYKRGGSLNKIMSM